jgi:hypothetical protein
VDIQTTSGAQPCHVDGAPCEVIQLIAAPLQRKTAGIKADEAAKVNDLLRANLPCGRCRKAEAQVAKLRRLGKLERRILLSAPAPDADSAYLPADGKSRANVEAHRRAIRRLECCGLLRLGWEDRHIARRHPWFYHKRCKATVAHRVVRLSEMGQVVVDRLRPMLKTCKRIRWDGHRAAILAAGRLTAPLLLNVLKDRAEGGLAWVRQVIGLLHSGLASPDADLLRTGAAYSTLLDICQSAVDNPEPTP